MVLSKKQVLSVSMFVAPLVLNACSGSSNSNAAANTGGASAGGISGTGGALATGGKNAGGNPATGGAAATGGLAATGGANLGGSTAATGGTVPITGGSATTGGKNAGGASTTGGTAAATGGTATATGGKSGGGTSATGGTATATGGTATATGGKSGGGATATGGTATATGGKSGGGTSAAGGTKNTGGATSTTCVAFDGGYVTAALFPGGLTLTKACSPYIISTVDGIEVTDDGVLTIEAGATLKFDVNTPIAVGGVGQGGSGKGKLLINGTAQDPVTLTSDVNPQNPGDWYGIEFSSGTVAGSKVSYTKISFAGGNYDGAIAGYVGVAAGAVTLDHVTIDNLGDTSDGIQTVDPLSNFTITNCTIGATSGPPNYPISVLAPSFAGIGAANAVAAGEMIEIAGGTIATTTAWTNPGIPIAVTSDLIVDGTTTPSLTLGAGMNLKFADGVALTVGGTSGGKLVVTGTTASHVALTSSDATPAAGAWAGVEILGSSKATISYADFLYGGSNTGNSKGNLSLLAATMAGQVTVDYSTFKNSKGWGIYQSCTTGVTTDANTTYATNTLGNKGPTTGTACP